MYIDLFGELKESKNEMRSIGLYQPFASLMHHGKIGTRFVRTGRKPGFPFGYYLFYSTKKLITEQQICDWCRPSILKRISDVLEGDVTLDLDGYALSIGELVNVRLMEKKDEFMAFCNYVGGVNSNSIPLTQWALEFENVQRIKPFEYIGSQGVRFVTPEERGKIYLL